MKSCLFTLLMSALLTGKALAASPLPLDFDRSAPSPAAFTQKAGAAVVPQLPAGGITAPAANAKSIEAGLTESKGGAPETQSDYRIVESVVQNGAEQSHKETICYKGGEMVSCFDEKTQQPVADTLIDGLTLKQIVQQALASSAEPLFHVAHDYGTTNGRQKFWCYGIWEEYNCHWVTRKIDLGTGGINWESVLECAGKRETGHHCDCVENCN